MSFINNTFATYQFGFLPGRSALQQLILFTEKLFDGKRNSTAVDVILMDFKKAFDSVSHNALLSKLQALGIAGNLYNWLNTYLKTRIQCVHIYSNYCAVLSGVHRAAYWAHYYLEFPLMIYLCQLSIQVHFYMQMTPSV